jgi:hypothetical protein
MLKTKIYIILFFTLFITSCKKAELKKPTDVELSFDFKKNFNSDIKVKLISGEINLVEFGITGTRIEGDDIQFTEKIENLLIPLDGEVNTSLLYQLPQGVYDFMELKVNIVANGNSPAIILNGTFRQGPSLTKNVVFTHNANESISIIGESSDNGGIVLTKTKTEKVDIIFDAIYWFETLTSEQLSVAETSLINDQETILINVSNNTNLYETIISRMNNSHRAVFN